MSHFIPQPLNIPHSPNKPAASARIIELKRDAVIARTPPITIAPKPNASLSNNYTDDAEIPNSPLSSIPNWAEELSKKYLSISLIAFANKLYKVYNVATNHRVCQNYAVYWTMCMNTCHDFSDDISGNRIRPV